MQFDITLVGVIYLSGRILDMSVSPDGLLLCTTSEDKALKIFDVVNFGKGWHFGVTLGVLLVNRLYCVLSVIIGDILSSCNYQ